MEVCLPLQAYELGPPGPQGPCGCTHRTASIKAWRSQAICRAELSWGGAPGGLSRLSICPTLDFSSGQDLKVMKSSPMSGSMPGMTPA